MFGDEKRPIPTPFTTRMSANQMYEKFTGSTISSRKLSAAISMPPVANGRAPKRSESYPDAGPATRKPAINGSM